MLNIKKVAALTVSLLFPFDLLTSPPDSAPHPPRREAVGLQTWREDLGWTSASRPSEQHDRDLDINKAFEIALGKRKLSLPPRKFIYSIRIDTNLFCLQKFTNSRIPLFCPLSLKADSTLGARLAILKSKRHNSIPSIRYTSSGSAAASPLAGQICVGKSIPL